MYVGMRPVADRHIRHLPILDKGCISGILTIGEVSGQIIVYIQQQTIQRVARYIPTRKKVAFSLAHPALHRRPI